MLLGFALLSLIANATPASASARAALDSASLQRLIAPLKSDGEWDAEARSGPAAKAAAATDAKRAAAEGAEDEGDDEGEEGDAPEEAESQARAQGPTLSGSQHPYSGDLSDADLEKRWLSDLAALGSISVGFADQGRVINAVQMPELNACVRVRPDLAWGAKETVDGLAAAFRAVHEEFPGSPPARLNHIGQRDGGFLRPHRSHQSGRDADIGFFYRSDVVPHGRGKREKLIDPARNWALVRALVTNADVQVILVDRGIQRVLRRHALEIGEDPGWVASLFEGGRTALIQHARRHRDHFHARFYAPRAQELGRRIQPLLAKRADQNLVVHRVRQGQTLGHLARSYKTTVIAIRKANGMKRTLLRVGQRVLVPLRGPCTKCPVVPALVVPPRKLPPSQGRASRAAPSSPTGGRSSSPL